MTAQLEHPTQTPPLPVVDGLVPDDPIGTEEKRTSSVARNIGSMLLGRAFTAALGWIGSIVIARALGAEEWGQYSFVFGLLGVLSVITDLGVGRVVLARLVGDSEAEARLVASSFIALRLVLGMVGYLGAVAFVVLAGYPGEVIVATLVAGLVVVVATPSHALTVLFQSRLKLTVISVVESLSQVVQLAATVVAVLVAPVLLVVVVPAVAFEVVSLLSKTWIIGAGRLSFRPAKRIEIWRWSEMLREALPLSIGFSLSVLLTKIDIPILSKLDSFEAVGHYAIAYKFSDVVAMIGIAITTPVVTVLVASWPNRLVEFRARLHGASILTVLLAGMAVIGVWPAATPLLRHLYGSAYADADDATRLLVLSAGLSSFTLLGVMTLVSAGRNRVFPLVALTGLILNVTLNVVLIPRLSFNGSAIATIITEVLVCVAIWITVVRQLRTPALLPWRRLAGLVVLIGLMVVAVTLISPSDSVVGIVLGVIGALALPVAARACRITDSVDPRRLLVGTASGEIDDPDEKTEDDDRPAIDVGHVVHTYFGPADTPLFGTLHIPSTSTARAGVVLCSSLGKEQMDSTRGVRMLGEDLAATGIVALRFDHLNTGESWGAQDSADAVENWIAGVAHAVDHLRGMGITTISVVGLRAGALIASAAVARIEGVAAVVFWDPVLRGRSFVRGQQQLFRIAVAADAGGTSARPTTADVVDIVGATWHADTAAHLSSLAVDTAALGDLPVLFAVADADASSGALRAQVDAAAGSVEVRTVGDPTGFISPPSFYVELPRAAVETIGSWLDERMPSSSTPIVVTPRTTAVMQTTGTGQEITTEVVTTDGGARVWITRAGTQPSSGIVMHSTANDVRTGPARLWQSAALRAAEMGAVTVRYDRVGVGESGAVVRRGDFALLHSEESVRDAHEVTALARTLTTGQITHAGVCSGAWLAARVALDDDNRDRVILVNLLSWRSDAPLVGADTVASFDSGPATTAAATAVTTSRSAALRSRVKPLAARYLPYAVFDLIARAGVMQSPRLLIGPLSRANIDTHLVFGEDDYAHFVSQRGLGALSSVARRGPAPTVHVAVGGDHPGFHPSVRDATLSACVHAIAIDNAGSR
ncbi:oligosaccharide flippase family protein [Williamsia maris]|uniref:Membrane protein involved in the export of O-antigen and teichoic acid n=1 Tax=Williamsia maris TaxID=72806 RepID=A0ABT1HFK6_9NOCA|nr:oligosaccharide flippase family protein [Williamsia maris]MCP2176516.1 Membrane protein involved in the export of O-antigen and teichoic acid [Williamsia maris]